METWNNPFSDDCGAGIHSQFIPMPRKSQALKGKTFAFFYVMFWRGCARDCGTDGGCGDVYPERPMFFLWRNTCSRPT